MKEDTNIPVDAIPRDLSNLNDVTGNLYEAIVILSKRANQLAKEEKEELLHKLADFAPKTDNLEEYFDNREQMEISAHYSGHLSRAGRLFRQGRESAGRAAKAAAANDAKGYNCRREKHPCDYQ